jgi:hypothetical protein
MVRERVIAGIYFTQTEVLNFVETEFRKTLIHGWLECFLKRHSGDIRKAVLAPEELPRLQIPRCYLDKYITLIKPWVPLVPAELIFNLDETGLSDWEERKPKPALIPTDLEDSHFHYPADRAIRHQTLLCCVSAAGDAYCLFLVSSNTSRQLQAQRSEDHGRRPVSVLLLGVEPNIYGWRKPKFVDRRTSWNYGRLNIRRNPYRRAGGKRSGDG